MDKRDQPMHNVNLFGVQIEGPLQPATTVAAYWRSRRFPLQDYAFTS